MARFGNRGLDHVAIAVTDVERSIAPEDADAPAIRILHIAFPHRSRRLREGACRACPRSDRDPLLRSRDRPFKDEAIGAPDFAIDGGDEIDFAIVK